MPPCAVSLQIMSPHLLLSHTFCAWVQGLSPNHIVQWHQLKIECKLFLQNARSWVIKVAGSYLACFLLLICRLPFCLCRLMQSWKVRQQYTWLLKKHTYTSWNCCLNSDLTWSSRFAVFSDSDIVCVCMRMYVHLGGYVMHAVLKVHVKSLSLVEDELCEPCIFFFGMYRSTNAMAKKSICSAELDLINSALIDRAYRWLCYCSLVSQARPTNPSTDRCQYTCPCTIYRKRSTLWLIGFKLIAWQLAVKCWLGIGFQILITNQRTITQPFSYACMCCVCIAHACTRYRRR